LSGVALGSFRFYPIIRWHRSVCLSTVLPFEHTARTWQTDRRLSVTFVHCAQTAEDIDTISFAHDSCMSLLDCFKIWFISNSLFLPKFCPKWPNHCWFEHRRHSMAYCGQMFKDAQWSHSQWI